MNIDWLHDHIYEILVGLSILFFLILIIFHKPISKWLSNKRDFALKLEKKPSQSHTTKKPIRKKNESRCREILERIYGRPFPTVRPNFLKRANGRNLELDGYCEELKLAFEYQGIQHDKFTRKFHKSKQDLVDQQQRDRDKLVLCQKAGVTVIIIPHTVRYEKLEQYILQELKKMNLIAHYP